MDQIFFVPDDWTISCEMDATSPAPTVVNDVVVNSFEFSSTSELKLTASWSQPAQVNGLLQNYSLCISREPVDMEACRFGAISVTVSSKCKL